MNNKKSGKNVFENIRFLLSVMIKENKLSVLVLIFLTLAVTVQHFSLILVPKFFLEELTGKRRFDRIIFIIIIFLLIAGISGFLSSYLKGKKLVYITNFRYKFLMKLYDKVLYTEMERLENNTTLDRFQMAFAAVNNDGVGIAGLYHALFTMFGNVTIFIGYCYIAFSIHPIILMYLILNVLIVYGTIIKAKKYEYSRRKELSNLTRKNMYVTDIMGDFTYGKEIRIFNLKDWLTNKFIIEATKKWKLNCQIINKYFVSRLVEMILLFFRDSIIYIYLAILIFKGELSIANFSVYVTAIIGFSSLMQQIIVDAAYIYNQNLYVNDYNFILDIKKNSTKLKDITEKNVKTVNKIEFIDVCFKYPNTSKFILNKFNLVIKENERLAIVGLNGSGKSTIVKLLCGLYSPTSGKILINGSDINCFLENDYLKLFSIIFQDFKIFPFSISDNITLSMPKDKLKLDESLKKVGLYEKIDELKYKSDTPLLKILDMDGIELSGGEYQKLAIARALYREGKILIMDEPTAALDPISEYEMFKKINLFSNKKMVIFITHRLSSVKFCDRIIFIENGCVLESGSHEQLMESKNKYYELFCSQAKNYTNGEKNFD